MTESRSRRDRSRLHPHISLGGNIYFLAKIFATDGESFQYAAARMTGMSQEDYTRMMLDAVAHMSRRTEGGRVMARITAGISCSHVPAIGAAIDLGKTQEPYWAPLFAGFEFSKPWMATHTPDVVFLVYNDHATAFSLDVIPTFAIGCAPEFAPADEGWGPRPVPVVRGAPELAAHICRERHPRGFRPHDREQDGRGSWAHRPVVADVRAAEEWPCLVIPFAVNVVQYPPPSGIAAISLGKALRRAIDSFDRGPERADLGHGRHEPSAPGSRAGLINQEFDTRFLDRMVPIPRRSRAFRASSTCAKRARKASSSSCGSSCAARSKGRCVKCTVLSRACFQYGGRTSHRGAAAEHARGGCRRRGRFGQKHLDATKLIEGVEVVSVVGRQLAPTEEVARKYGVPHATRISARRSRVRVSTPSFCCTPTQMHAAQVLQCLNAGIHVQVEIPLADRLKDAEGVAELAQRTALVCMVGHTRSFNPSHQWVHRRIVAGEMAVQQMDVQRTFSGVPTSMRWVNRSWTDHLLWHHAAHTVDLFRYQTRSEIVRANAVQGPSTRRSVSRWTCRSSCRRPVARSARCRCRSIMTAARHVLPLHIRDDGTYIARYDELVDGKNNAIDVSAGLSLNGIELQDREFFAAIRERRAANSSVAQVLPCYRTLAEPELQLCPDPTAIAPMMLQPAAAAGTHARPRGTQGGTRKAEDSAIRDVVRVQEELGLQGVTDGEFRLFWHMDFLYQIGGVRKVQQNITVHFHSEKGDVDFTPSGLKVEGRLTLDGGTSSAITSIS